MYIYDDLLDRLVRFGEGQTVLSSSPKLDQIIDNNGGLLQSGGQVPMLDALRAVLGCAERLSRCSGHDPECSVYAVDKGSLTNLIVSLVRVESPQQSILQKPLGKVIEGELKQVNGAIKAAEKAAAAIEKNRRLPMEKFQDMLGTSPDPALALRLLCSAGPKQPSLVGPNGPFQSLSADMPQTLPSGTAVELKIRVWTVKEKEGVARVQICDYLDEHSRRVLRNHLPEVSMSFNKESIHRDDLLAVQYLQKTIRIRAAAECATSDQFARKTTLNLLDILDGRRALDRLHILVRQGEFSFTSEDPSNEPVGDVRS